MRLELPRRRRLERDEQVVQASGAGQSGIERRLQHGLLALQRAARGLERESLQKLFRRDSRPAPEHPREVMRCDARGLCDLLEPRLFAESLVHVADGALDATVVE